MNPLVEQMLNATVETRLLEDLFEHEAKCELNHQDIPCSVKVTAIHTCACDGSTRFRCQNGVTWVNQFTRRGGICTRCDHLASECWTIRPI